MICCKLSHGLRCSMKEQLWKMAKVAVFGTPTVTRKVIFTRMFWSLEKCHTSIWPGHVKRDDKYKVVNKSSQLSIKINWLRIFLPPNLQGRFLGTPMETLLLTNTTVLRYLHELCFMSIFFFIVIKFGLTEECTEVWEIFMYTIFPCAMNFTFLNLRYLKTICEWNVYLCRRTSGWWKIWAWMHTASQLHGPAPSHVCE